MSTGLLDSASEKHKVRLRALTTSNSNIQSVREPTSADETALYRRQLRRQKQREWLRTSGAALERGAAPGGAGKAAGGDNGVAPTGALGSVARALEMGMDEEQSLARAKLQLKQRELRAAQVSSG